MVSPVVGEIPASAIAQLRASHPAFGILQVNTGTKGITAPPVIEALLEMTRRIEYGGFQGYGEIQERAAAARDRLARFFGADPSEMAFTGNATESLNVALALPWERWGAPVDVLISDHEYPTTNMVFGYLRQIGKIRLVRYPLSADPQETCDALERRVTPRTRLLVASHVDCNTGLRADARALCSWARARGIVSYIDGAQAAGQFPIDLHDIGCDLYVTNGHKWLYGPNGVGLLYIRDSVEALLTPPMAGMGTMHFSADHEYTGDPRWVDGAHRFELTATRPAQVLAAMDAALDWYEGFGPGAIEARQRALAAHVHRRIREMPERFTAITPVAWERSSALVSIRIAGCDGAQIGAFCGRMLREGRAFLRPVPEFDALRISTAYYNVEDDYERLWEMLAELQKETTP